MLDEVNVEADIDLLSLVPHRPRQAGFVLHAWYLPASPLARTQPPRHAQARRP